MNKNKTTIISFSIVIILCFNISVFAQKVNVIHAGFKNKKEIIKWGEKEFGYCGDSISFNIEGQNIFILFGDYAFGVSYKTIFIFYGDDEDYGGEWGLFCMRRTNTSKVVADLDKNKRELVFKSKTGKTLMILPFETIKLQYDSSEQ